MHGTYKQLPLSSEIWVTLLFILEIFYTMCIDL